MQLSASVIFCVSVILASIFVYSQLPKPNPDNLKHLDDVIIPQVKKFVNTTKTKINKKILFPLPDKDFDPTEVALAWQILKDYGINVVFATENGDKPEADLITLYGKGLNHITRFIFDFVIDVRVRNTLVLDAYRKMELDPSFSKPITWDSINVSKYDALYLAGGHAQGMKQYLDSVLLQSKVSQFWELNRPVAAVCHGVLVLARSKKIGSNDQSLLAGRKTTSLINFMERLAHAFTFWSHGDLFRTYSISTEDEVKQAVYGATEIPQANELNKRQQLYDHGTFPDKSFELGKGYIVEDGNYLSGRWPGDVALLAQRLAQKTAGLL
jgi:putative intracellular protease/amidase